MKTYNACLRENLRIKHILQLFYKIPVDNKANTRKKTFSKLFIRFQILKGRISNIKIYFQGNMPLKMNL